MQENVIKTKREEMMASGPILRTMFALGVPSFLAQLINLLYNIVDRAYIGHIKDIGGAALTGVGLCMPIVTFIAAFASLVGGGGAPLAGIAFGQGNRDRAERILGNGVTLLLAFGLSLTVIFQIVKKPFIMLFGASESTYEYSDAYLTVYLCGTVFVMLAMGLNSYITVQGEATIAMASVAIGAFLNLALDPLFIFVFKMGVTGAALATVISQAISAAWIIRFLISKSAALKIRPKNLKLTAEIVGKIVALGVSPFMMNATESFISVVFNSGAQKYGGDLYVGSITILQSVVMIIFAPMGGFTQGVAPFISYNYGAGNYKRVKQICLSLITMASSFTFVFCGAFMLFPGFAASVFTDDTELIELCSRVMPIFIAGMLVFGLQSSCQPCFMALGKAKQALFFALFRKVILLIPLALILPWATGNVYALYYAEPISDICSAVCCIIVFVITLHNVMKENKEGR